MPISVPEARGRYFIFQGFPSTGGQEGTVDRRRRWEGQEDSRKTLRAKFLGLLGGPGQSKIYSPSVSDQHLHPHPTFELRKGVFC